MTNLDDHNHESGSDAKTAAPDRHCPMCGYNLRGLVTSRCPECGSRFDLRDLAARPPFLSKAWRRLFFGPPIAGLAWALLLAVVSNGELDLNLTDLLGAAGVVLLCTACVVTSMTLSADTVVRWRRQFTAAGPQAIIVEIMTATTIVGLAIVICAVQIVLALLGPFVAFLLSSAGMA